MGRYRLGLSPRSRSQVEVFLQLEVLGIRPESLDWALEGCAAVAIIFTPGGSIHRPSTLYLAWAAMRSRSVEGDTVRVYGECLVDWLGYIEQRAFAEESIREVHLQRYRTDLIKKGSSPATTRLRVRVVIDYLTWIHSSKLVLSPLGQELSLYASVIPSNNRYASRRRVVVDPRRPQISLPKVESRLPKRVNAVEFMGIMSTIGRPYDLISKWAITTGMRRFEICGLKVSTLLKAQSGQNAPSLYELSIARKGGKQRRVYVVPDLFNETVRYINTERRPPRGRPSDVVFLGPTGQPIDKGNVSKKFSRAATSLGIQATFHHLRHTYALTVLEHLERQEAAGSEINPLKTLQILMGHESIETTDIYLRALEISSPSVESALGFLYGFGA